MPLHRASYSSAPICCSCKQQSIVFNVLFPIKLNKAGLLSGDALQTPLVLLIPLRSLMIVKTQCSLQAHATKKVFPFAEDESC